MNFNTILLSAFAAANLIFVWGAPQKVNANIRGQETQAVAIDLLLGPLRQSTIDEQDNKSVKWRNK
jgi:hypothetical protein